MKNKKLQIVLGLMMALVMCQSSVYSQLIPVGWKKLCLEENVTSVMYIKNHQNILWVKASYGSSLCGINNDTDELVWESKSTQKYKIGYGLYSYGDKLMYSSNANTMDAKGKITIASYIFWLNTSQGMTLDSLKLSYDAIYLSDSPGKSGNLALIRMTNDSKYSAVLVDVSTGAVKYELFKEDAKTGEIPNAIQVDENEKYIAMGTANGKKGFFLYDFSTGKQLMNLTSEGDIHSLEFSSDSKFCFYVQKKKLNVVNLSSLKLEKQIQLPFDGIHVTIHSDNENMVITGFGTKIPVMFLNWKTEKIEKSDLTTAGGKSDFNEQGDLYVCNSSGAVQCFVNKDKLPYLAKFTFSSLDKDVETIKEPVSPNKEMVFGVGSRAMIYYAGDKKYYSGTIYEITSDGFKVVYDDASRASVKKNEVKALPEIKKGSSVQCFRSDKKFYWATVVDIQSHIVQVKYSNNTTEWVPMKDIMLVE